MTTYLRAKANRSCCREGFKLLQQTFPDATAHDLSEFLTTRETGSPGYSLVQAVHDYAGQPGYR